jgi:hypothetical protein
MVAVSTAAATVFNEDACVQCVDNPAVNGASTANFTANSVKDNLYFNDDDIVIFGNGGIYCDQGGDEYVCLTGTTATSGSSNSNTCSGNSYTDESACTGVLGDNVVGLAKSILIVIIVLSCCCCAAIVAAIAGCIYCCVKGNAPVTAGVVPGAYQTNPALLQQHQQQSLAPKPALVLPGKSNMAPPVTTTTTPTQTGLATTAYQPAYQPAYQLEYQSQSQTNIPFAKALSVEHDGTTTKRY